jgi:DNA-binding LacI/PurR family transcriptional regulator/DNA-binding transcriptional regulator YhcF (GntR family)
MSPRAASQDVIAQMRQLILDGSWPPGFRIPIKTELCTRFSASDGTVQRALATLGAQGFLKARGRLGTFVREQTPNRHRIALALATPQGKSVWIDAVADAAASIGHAGRWWIEPYYHTGLDEQGNPAPGHEALTRDVRDGRVAGVIFCGLSPRSHLDPALNQRRLARSSLGLSPVLGGRESGVVFGDYTDWALRFFAARSRRRLALFTTFSHLGRSTDAILAKARRLGLLVHRRWVHHIDPKTDMSTRPIAELLMSLPKRDRPDALFVHDDHLLQKVAQGIHDAGVKVPGDVDVVSLANFPRALGAAVGVTYVGPDMREAVDLSLQQIAQQLDGSAHEVRTAMTQISVRLARGVPAKPSATSYPPFRNVDALAGPL